MAVVAPMPRASVRTDMEVKVGARRRTRIAYRRSCRISEIHSRLCSARLSALDSPSSSRRTCPRSPSLSSAAARASALLIPCRL